MELLTNHLQVFVSVIVILGAAGVALVCDLLKSNNEHLREVNTELRVRATFTPVAAAAHAPLAQLQAAPAAHAAIAAPPAPAPIADEPARIPVAAAQAPLQRGAELTSRRGSRPAAAAVADAPEERLPGASLAEARMLAREFIGRSSERTRPPAPVSTQTPQQPEIMLEKAAPAAAASTHVPRPVQRKDWGTLLNKTKSAERPTVDLTPEPKQRMAELIPFETIQNNTPGDLAIPAGFHEGMMLARILNSEKTMRGLVVVVGINDFDARRNNTGHLGAEALSASVSDHIRSILRPGDFACQSSEDEFLMICPNERDGQAQRRLGEIAETLWDYQLRSVGTSMILFSWGGVEAKGESFADVFAAAAERMRETRRSRRSLSLEAPRKKAV